VIIELPPPALEFCVYGIPAPKGSKRAFAIRKRGVPTGQVAVVDADKGRGPLRDWITAVNGVVQGMAGSGAQKLEGPLEAHVTFYPPKPKSAPKTRRIWPGRKPDLDKLLRAIFDPLSGVLIRDDAQIVRLDARKEYADDQVGDQTPRAEVRIWRTEDLYSKPVEIPANQGVLS